ncbi:MAG TPA: DUF6279 family lipoprotein [Nitrospira sp.]|nr:DUF6279 family lipoprotein [Nitrospira sp.]
MGIHKAGRVLLVTLGLALLAFTGCAATSLLYNHADWLIARQIDGYFGLNRTQKTFVSSRLSGILAHHRREALPRYEAVLRQARDRAADGLTIADVDWAFSQYDQLRTDLFARFTADGSEFVQQVNDPQVSQLKQALQRRLARQEDLLRDDVRTRLAKRTERILGLAREWMGRLSAEQEQEIARMTMQFPDTLPSWYAHQLYRHEQLIALFESRKSDQTMERLQDWLIHQDYDTDPRFAEMTKELRRHITELVLALDRSANPAQRRYFLSKIDDLTALVRRLQAA